MPNQFKRVNEPDSESVTVNLFCYGNDVRADEVTVRVRGFGRRAAD